MSAILDRRLNLLAAVVGCLLAGCTTVVRPPAGPAETVEVYLLDHGRTSSLVLPAGGGRSARWAYGDWQWYALGRTTPATALAALLWPTAGALGREELAGGAAAATVRDEVSVETDAVHPLLVERRRVEALVADLEALFEENRASRVVNPDSGLVFVRHPAPYSLRHSSNRVVAAWLRELGCEVAGPALLARWRVERAKAVAERSAMIAAD